MLNKNLLAILTMAVIVGCTTTKTITLPEQTIIVEDPNKTPVRPIYNGSNTRVFDLLHTKLDVRFNWEKSYMYGKAELTLTPYFYPKNKLVLDARGMDINKVMFVIPNSKNEIIEIVEDLKYEYDSLKLTIDLGKEFTRKDTFKIFIDYTAKPNELPSGGSAAISDDKGLYFINPKGEEKNKPMQIWTQGETQSNSAWFPTIDSPNEKMTQEIGITVEEKYKTLSNGVLVSQEINADGTRTDYWEMTKPNTPYLFMMAIGDFAIVKDKWRNIEVNYYVEKEYEQYAKDIFGLTPEMLEFFSNKLGVDYPWVKYSQVVVRDYVSGAMENTSAVIHGGFVQQTKRELIDGSDGEDVIAHELFHHWFGDLVTCESWANLPLNESFATYGEVLWREYKYGDDKGAHGLQNDLNVYLQQAQQGYVDMVRFNYAHREDMFDGNTYQKGGRILHMLRNYIGDDAFFESLRIYLEENKYTAVEMHQLRMACEKVTGEDLNWFFNQWFYAKGHPILDINYEYNDSLKTQTITVEQTQDFNEVPLYRLPVKIDLYVGGKKETKEVVIDEVMNTFTFEVEARPDLVNFDGDKMLLCEKVDNHKDLQEYLFMYANAAKYLDRYEAIRKFSKSGDPVAIEGITIALKDQYSYLRRTAIKGIKKAVKNNKEEIKIILLDLAKNDKNSKVRGDAITALAKYYENDEEVKDVMVKGVSEQSYYVIGKSLSALSKTSPEDAMKFAKTLEEDDNSRIIGSVGVVYAEHGEAAQNDFFIKTSKKMEGFEMYGFVLTYSKYLKKQNHETVEAGLPILEDVAKNETAWWMRMTGINALVDLETKYANQIHVAETEMKEINPGSDKELELRNALEKDRAIHQKIEAIVNDIKTNEKNPRLRKMLGLKD
jgi:aminopeptidase N